MKLPVSLVTCWDCRCHGLRCCAGIVPAMYGHSHPSQVEHALVAARTHMHSMDDLGLAEDPERHKRPRLED